MVITDTAGNTKNVTGASTTLDTSADLGAPLTLSITDTTINNSEKTAVAFTVSGIDPDVAGADATVTFSDSVLAHNATVLASTGTVNLSAMNNGPISSVLNVTDDAGNTASANGPATDLFPYTTLFRSLTLSITDTTINNSEKTAVAFTVSGIDPDVAGADATVTFSD